jgi:hypothetical protein
VGALARFDVFTMRVGDAGGPLVNSDLVQSYDPRRVGVPNVDGTIRTEIEKQQR